MQTEAIAHLRWIHSESRANGHLTIMVLLLLYLGSIHLESGMKCVQCSVEEFANDAERITQKVVMSAGERPLSAQYGFIKIEFLLRLFSLSTVCVFCQRERESDRKKMLEEGFQLQWSIVKGSVCAHTQLVHISHRSPVHVVAHFAAAFFCKKHRKEEWSFSSIASRRRVLRL